MAVKTAIITRTVTIFSHDPDGACRRIMHLARKGAREAVAIDSAIHHGQRIVVARVKVGSEAETLVLKLQARGEELARIGEAIREGRAYLDTFNGRRKVVSYNDRTGDAITNNTGDWINQQTYLVCIDRIQIEEPAAVAV
jgi:hypothetical protein